jgi:hypothetical protein
MEIRNVKKIGTNPLESGITLSKSILKALRN